MQQTHRRSNCFTLKEFHLLPRDQFILCCLQPESCHQAWLTEPYVRKFQEGSLKRATDGISCTEVFSLLWQFSDFLLQIQSVIFWSKSQEEKIQCAESHQGCLTVRKSSYWRFAWRCVRVCLCSTWFDPWFWRLTEPKTVKLKKSEYVSKFHAVNSENNLRQNLESINDRTKIITDMTNYHV